MKQLKDIKAVCDFIKENSSTEKFGFYVERLQQALEDLKQILESKKNKKISDKDLARVLKCINNTKYSVRIKEKTTGTESALACAPLELVEFIIQNAQGKDFESFLQDKIEEYKILTTKGNKYGTIFEEDEWDLAYFLSLQKFMQGLESLEKGEAVVVDDETFKMFARIEEIPRNLLV